MRFNTPVIAAMLSAAISSTSGQSTNDARSTEGAVYFTGEVLVEGGAVPPDPVLIRRICKGSVQGETWSDSKGRFNFKVAGGGTDSTADAAQPPARDPDLSRPIGNSTYYSNPITTALRDCEVQAVLAGYWSDRVSIALKNTLDDKRIGTLILHPISRDQALTISATTLAAPRNALKAYEKGMSEMRERRWDAATLDFTKAVEAYPKFAAAWFTLGLLRQSRNDLPGAVEAWKEALKSDPRYEKPYEGLAAVAERQQNWTDVEKYSREWIHLTPEGFPMAYLYNAIANAQLNKMTESEAAAREGLRLDKDHKIPRLSYVMGLILMQKHEYSDSAKFLRVYLELAPNAKDAAVVRQELAKMEASATTPPQ